MPVLVARTNEEILATRSCMLELRPRVAPEDYLSRVQSQMRQSYRIAYIPGPDGQAVACMGFREIEHLFAGHCFYVDDLITSEKERSKGHGKTLLDWCQEEAKRLGLNAIRLDSGHWRKDAHRFYHREGFPDIGLQFTKEIKAP